MIRDRERRPSAPPIPPRSQREKAARRRPLWGWLVVLAVLLPLFPSRAFAQQPMENDAPLGLADLAAERAALAGKIEGDAPPRPTTFRELWDHPENHRGRRVIVSGRIVRIFRQGAVGDFPSLVEAWIEEPPGNLFCAVFEPRPDGEVKTGRFVAFTGVYLRRVRYEAGGGSRLAPLIVGAEPPRIEKPAPTGEGRGVGAKPPAAPALARPWTNLGGTLALLVALAAIAALLARWSLSGQSPRRRRKPNDGAAAADSVPEFLDPESADDDPR